MSTHEVKVVTVPEIRKHPSADKLGLVSIWGYTVVVAMDQWKEGDLAAYIEPDYTVDVNREEFAFLKRYENKPRERIKVKKLRGIYSQGLLVPAPPGSKVDDDVMDLLGVKRYIPKTDSTQTKGASESGLKIPVPKYDLENYKKYGRYLVEGEEIAITEKLHGCNARFVFSEGRMWCGSRTRWVMPSKEGEKINIWWAVLEQTPWIKEFCEAHPDHVLYGEIYGWVQDLRYGHEQGQYSFRVFDIWKQDGDRWGFLDWVELIKFKSYDGIGFSIVPILYVGPFSDEAVKKYTDGKTLIDMPGKKHIREGCVIKPVRERIHERFGRIALKSVSDKYLESSND